MTASVTALVAHYKRPGNIEAILRTLREQAEVLLVDASHAREFALCIETARLAHHYVRLGRNYGSINRHFVSRLVGTEFLYIHDDDMLPGPRVVAHFLRYAHGEFGVLGQIARNVGPKLEYRPMDVPRTDELREVDVIIRGYFLRTSNLKFVDETMSCLHRNGLTYSDYGTEDEPITQLLDEASWIAQFRNPLCTARRSCQLPGVELRLCSSSSPRALGTPSEIFAHHA